MYARLLSSALMFVLIVSSNSSVAQKMGGPPIRYPHTLGYITATELPNGPIPPAGVDGNYIVGPMHDPDSAMSRQEGVPRGQVFNLTMESADSKIYPGMRKQKGIHGRSNPSAPSKVIMVTSGPAPYTRKVSVYVPKHYVPGIEAPFIIGADGPDRSLFVALDNLIAEGRVPAMVAISISNGSGDAQGSQRGLEYDTMSGLYAEFVETEVLPLVEKKCNVKLTKDPEKRATMGYSSGVSYALSMAW